VTAARIADLFQREQTAVQAVQENTTTVAMELISRGLSIDGPDALVNQPFEQGVSKKALLAQKIAKVLICLAKVPRSLTKLSGNDDLFQSGVHELPRALHGRGKFFWERSLWPRFRDGLHMGSETRLRMGEKANNLFLV
jgi:hypothetical protein